MLLMRLLGGGVLQAARLSAEPVLKTQKLHSPKPSMVFDRQIASS